MSYLLLTLGLTFTLLGCNPQPKTEKSAITDNVSHANNASGSHSKPCHLTLGFDVWEPYQYEEISGNITGLDIELITLVIEKMDCQVSFKKGAWVDLLKAVKDGSVDLLLGASKTKAREEYALFSHAYRKESFSLYIRKDDSNLAKYQSIDDFIKNQHKIGIVEDYYYGPKIAMLLEGSVTSKNFINAKLGELNVARLLDSDIDAFIEDSYVGASVLRRKGLASLISQQGNPITTDDAYVMFSRKSFSPEQLEVFNTMLQNVRETPPFTEIFQRYSK